MSFFCKFLGEGKSKGESAESKLDSAELIELQNKLIDAIGKLIDKHYEPIEPSHDKDFHPTEMLSKSAESVELQKKLIEVIGKLIGNQGSYAEMRGKISTAGFDCEFFCRTCKKMADFEKKQPGQDFRENYDVEEKEDVDEKEGKKILDQIAELMVVLKKQEKVIDKLAEKISRAIENKGLDDDSEESRAAFEQLRLFLTSAKMDKALSTMMSAKKGQSKGKSWSFHPLPTSDSSTAVA